MESDTLFSQRPVTKVYKRKKGRRQRFPQKLAPSPLRNGITINQDSSEEEEEGEKEAEAGQPPVTPHGSPKQNSSPQKFSRSTPPSTPSRKQKVSSRKSSPSKSSTSSPSKINIDREIGNIFSPNKKVGVFLDDEEDINEPAWDLPSPSPKKPSFADRMAPRKAKKEDKGNVEQADQEEEGGEQMVSDFEFISQRADTSQGSTQQGEQPLPMIESAKCKPQSRIYKRVPSLPEVDLQSASLIIDGLGEPRPCLKEMSKRWAELDDLDDTDEESTAVNSITDLRSLGQNRRFREDFQYLVLDLRSSQSLADRRSTCVEIAKKVLAGEHVSEVQESSEEAGVEDHQSSGLTTASSISPFLSQIKIADLTNQFWTQLRGAGAGNGEDQVLDLAFLLICLKMSQCDVEMAMSFCGQDDFNTCMTLLMSSTATKENQEQIVQQHLATLNKLAKTSLHIQMISEVDIVPRLALQTVWLLVESNGQSSATPRINIAKKQGNNSIAGQLWQWFAAERWLYTGLDDEGIHLVAQILLSCIDQLDNDSHLESSAADVSLYARHFGSMSIDSRSGYKSSDEPLCSVLRLMIALMAKTGSKWTTKFLQDKDLLNVLVQLMAASAINLIGIDLQQDCSKQADSLTLVLAILTDFLVKDPVTVGEAIVVYRHEKVRRQQITLLSRLLQQEKERSEVDPSAGYLAGSLAIVISLVIIGHETNKDKQFISNQREGIPEQVKQGLQCSTYPKCLTILLNSINDFAAMVQVASKQYYTLFDKSKQERSESMEDQEFFSHLSTSLEELLEASSSDNAT